MKTAIQNLLLTVAMISSSLAFAGQHSGLGGGAPPSPKPVPEPSWYASIEEYYNAYVEWLKEQAGLQSEPANLVDEKK
jgi:hypothetical protein